MENKDIEVGLQVKSCCDLKRYCLICIFVNIACLLVYAEEIKLHGIESLMLVNQMYCLHCHFD